MTKITKVQRDMLAAIKADNYSAANANKSSNKVKSRLYAMGLIEWNHDRGTGRQLTDAGFAALHKPVIGTTVKKLTKPQIAALEAIQAGNVSHGTIHNGVKTRLTSAGLITWCFKTNTCELTFAGLKALNAA